MKRSAYLLVSHGSRDPRPQVAVETLAALVAQQFQARYDAAHPVSENYLVLTGANRLDAIAPPPQPPLIATAVLELHPLPFHQQLLQVAETAIASGYTQLQIVPLFLLPGMHVMEDIPGEIAIAQQILGSSISLAQCPYLGSHPKLRELLTIPSGSSPYAATILISHGSRRSGGNRIVEAIAQQLNAHPAYWSVTPAMDQQVAELVKMGYREIWILPYFLFSGGILDAIAQQIQHLTTQFPLVRLHLADPIGATPALAELVIDIVCPRKKMW